MQYEETYIETNNKAGIEPGPAVSRRKASKRQADRLLKQLPLSERRRQQQIRQLILTDPLFGGRIHSTASISI